MNLPQKLVQHGLFDEGHLHIRQRFAIAQTDCGFQQVSDVIHAAPDLRDTAIHVHQRVDRDHRRAHGILRGEYRVPRQFREVAQESEIHRAFGHDFGAISGPARHEIRAGKGHHGGDGLRAVCRQILDLILRDADVIQPLHADFFAGAVPHVLFDVIARHIRIQAVKPYEALILGLAVELRLPVDRPAQKPSGIPRGADAAGNHLAGQRVALADVPDIGKDPLIQRIHGYTHPFAFIRIAIKLLRMAKGRVLRGDLPPKIEGSARLDLRPVFAGFVLAANGGVFHIAAVGDEQIVVLGQIQPPRLIVRQQLHAPGHLSAIGDLKAHIHDLCVEVELCAMIFQVLYHRKDHGFVLVVLGESERTKIRQPVDMMDEPLHIALHLQRAVAVVEGEHRAPVGPEVAVQHLRAQYIRDAPVGQRLIGREEQLH